MKVEEGRIGERWQSEYKLVAFGCCAGLIVFNVTFIRADRRHRSLFIELRISWCLRRLLWQN